MCMVDSNTEYFYCCLTKSIQNFRMSMLLGRRKRTLPPATPKETQSRHYQQMAHFDFETSWKEL